MPNFHVEPEHPAIITRVQKNIYGFPQVEEKYAVGLENHLPRDKDVQFHSGANFHIKNTPVAAINLLTTVKEFEVYPLWLFVSRKFQLNKNEPNQIYEGLCVKIDHIF